MTSQAFWRDFFGQVVAVVHPAVCLPKFLPDPKHYSSIKVVAAGKAAAAMAETLELAWPDQELTGIAVCPYGHERPCRKIEVMTAAHPVPDENSVVAAERALAIAAATKPGELLLALLSGGGSSLLCAPVEGLPLADKQQLTRDLLASGASISEVNLIRGYYSRIKAGKLLAQVNELSEVITLAISDVVGDEPRFIASGPTVPTADSANEVESLLAKYKVLPPTVLTTATCQHYAASEYKIVANAGHAFAVAERQLAALGYRVHNLGVAIEGEARDVAFEHAVYIQEKVVKNPNMKLAFLSGGELTVTLQGQGKGGPNQEYLLAIMAELSAGKYAGFAADTDGHDGVGGAAGAFFNGRQHLRAEREQVYIEYLENNDSYSFFNRIGGLFKVSPTFTNVNDIRVILYDT